MSRFDGLEDEMRRLSDMDDRDVDRLLAGQVPADDAELTEVARFLASLEPSCAGVPTPSVEAAHLAAMAQAAQLLADKGEPAARPASKAHVPAEQVSELPKWRGSPMIQKLIATKWAKITAVAAALVLALGGTAFAGVLPTPLQDTVAGAAETVGIDLPDSHEAEEASDNNAADTDVEDDAPGSDSDDAPVAAPAPQPAPKSPPAKTSAPSKRKSAPADADDDEDDDADEDEDEGDDDADEDEDDDEDDEDEDEDDEHEDDDEDDEEDEQDEEDD